MKITTLAIQDIIVSDRRRDDFGDMDGLVESIRRFGLLHPITVDDQNNLIAGERRLRACQLLDWTEIDCRLFRDLTDDERREIELEENIRRKDLTPLEVSKNLVSLAQVAENVIQSEFLPRGGNKSKGRPEQPVTDAKVSERIGIPRSTIQEAKAHVEAVNSYPELEASPKKEAIKTATALNKLPEPKREQVRADQSKLRQIISKPSLPKPSKRSPLSQIQEVIYQIKQKGGALSFTGNMSQQEQFTFRDELQTCRDELDKFVCEITDYLDDLREAS